MKLIVHHKISDLYKSLNLPIEQEMDFTIHFLPDIHSKTPFKSPVFRADYFSFVFIKEGSGNYTIDDKTFSFASQTIYFTNPGHIKSFEIENSKDAYIITLTESFLRENVHPDIFGEFPFLLAETVPPKKMLQNDFSEFEILYKQIFNEFKIKSEYKNKILGNLFVVLLLKIKEKFWLSYNPIEEGDRNSQIVKSFKILLEREFKKATSTGMNITIQVQDYANELNLHPNYLNSVIKSKTGRTVNDWISKRTLSVAKSLLKNTTYSSKEIAYKLGFSEPTHFSRFFKKHTQLSPNTFRKSNQ
ncbi:MAG: helix-turn-helix domain-containing protein [Mangrovimonas sp.]|nr:helix-turn-helix domain-containing protein [Mangrovimonas sp.]MCB0537596.1 helix-turn-helix domain-containing protein [Bacteroidota bacterium]